MSDPLGAEERAALGREIAVGGFEADPLVPEGPWVRTWGLNLALCWPLPVARHAYDAMTAELRALDPGLFVYPHAQTHVTVLTLVSFKEHVEPGLDEERALAALIPLARDAVTSAAEPGPIALEIGAPVLSRRAAFFPIADPAGAVARLRQRVLPALRAASPAFASLQPLRAVHSTLARFRAVPAPGFEARFEDWASERALGPIRAEALLMTTETRPYMREGQVVGRWP